MHKSMSYPDRDIYSGLRDNYSGVGDIYFGKRASTSESVHLLRKALHQLRK